MAFNDALTKKFHENFINRENFCAEVANFFTVTVEFALSSSPTINANFAPDFAVDFIKKIENLLKTLAD